LTTLSIEENSSKKEAQKQQERERYGRQLEEARKSRTTAAAATTLTAVSTGSSAAKYEMIGKRSSADLEEGEDNGEEIELVGRQMELIPNSNLFTKANKNTSSRTNGEMFTDLHETAAALDATEEKRKQSEAILDSQISAKKRLKKSDIHSIPAKTVNTSQIEEVGTSSDAFKVKERDNISERTSSNRCAPVGSGGAAGGIGGGNVDAVSCKEDQRSTRTTEIHSQSRIIFNTD
jgi:hypothetical protein